MTAHLFGLIYIILFSIIYCLYKLLINKGKIKYQPIIAASLFIIIYI